MSLNFLSKKASNKFNLLDSQLDYQPLKKQKISQRSSINLFPELSKSWIQHINQHPKQNYNHPSLKKLKESLKNSDDSPKKQTILSSLICEKIEAQQIQCQNKKRSKSTISKQRNLEILPLYLNFLRSKQDDDKLRSSESQQLQGIMNFKESNSQLEQKHSSLRQLKQYNFLVLAKKMIQGQKQIQSIRSISTNKSEKRLFQEKQSFYDRKMKDRIKYLKQVIRELLSNLSQLKAYINNEKKLFSTLKKLIKYNQRLKMIFINETNSGLIELTEQNILKKIEYDELVNINGKQTSIRKFEFSFLTDLQELKDNIVNFILARKVNQIQMVQNSIIEESISVQNIESKIFVQDRYKKLMKENTYIPVQNQRFSFKGLPMLSYNPQNSLEEVEKRLGESRKISLTSRTTAKSIESVIQKLNKFAKANNENFNKFIN